MGTFRDFLKSKAGKAQIICEVAFIAATALAVHLRNIEALKILLPIGSVVIILFMTYGFWVATRKVKRQ